VDAFESPGSPDLAVYPTTAGHDEGHAVIRKRRQSLPRASRFWL